MTTKSKRPVGLLSVQVFMVLRVADDTAQELKEEIEQALMDREIHDEEPDTELLYEAAKQHLEAVASELGIELTGDYDISRDNITVKRRSEP